MYGYGLSRSFDNEVLNLYLKICRRVRRTSHTFLVYFREGGDNRL